MNCNDVQNLIDGYVDGELDLLNSLGIERHIQSCTPCTQIYKNRQALQAAFSNANLYQRAPATLQKRIESSLHKAGRVAPSPRAIVWRTLIAAAALTLLLVISWNILRIVTPPSSSNSLTQQIFSNHLRSLISQTHLVDVISTDQHTIKPWFDTRGLNYSPPVVDLTRQGYTMVGGRVDYIDNRYVAVIVYKYGGHTINLFVWPADQNDNSAMANSTQQGYHLIPWTQSGMIYWAVSDLEEDKLLNFVHLIQQNTP